MHHASNAIHLLDYWRILRRRWRLVTAVFFVVVGLVAAYAFMATPVYEGTAQLLVDTEKNQTLNFAEGAAVVLRDTAEYFNTQKEILGSRLFANRVVRKLQLDKNPYFIEQKRLALERRAGGLRGLEDRITGLLPERGRPLKSALPPQTGDELDPALVDLVLENLKPVFTRQSNVMKLTYTAADPGVAATVANGAAIALIEYNLTLRVKPFQDAADWLSARLVESKAKVEESEKTLQQYREGKGVVSFESKESVLTQQLQELVSQLVQTEAKRQEAEIRYNQIQSVIDSPERLATVPDIMNNLVIQGLRNDELGLKRQLSELSEKYGPRHPQIIKVASQLETVQNSIVAEARKMLSTAKSELDLARSREVSLRQTLEQQKQEVLDLSRKAIQFNVLAGESGSNKQFYDLLLKKLQEASLSSGINVSNLQIVDYAVAPQSPVKPRRGLLLALALFLGAAGGVLLAFFAEYMDDTIRTQDDVEKRLGLPFLGVVPGAADKAGPIFMTTDPKSALAECFRTIRTGVRLAGVDKPQKVLLVTSSIPNEGKTTVSANLAVAFAQAGERVLIIDTDMRRHNIHDLFGVDPEMGISDVLASPELLTKSMKRLPEAPNLFILTGGSLAPNPSELLGSARMTELVALLGERFDRVILDAPPLRIFSDALVLSQMADGVILVLWAGSTPRPVVQQSVDALRGVKAKILGVVINKVDASNSSDYYYYSAPYYASYYAKKGKKRRRRKKQ